ncbi:hypothetical protein [Fervidibacter sacchari]
MTLTTHLSLVCFSRLVSVKFRHIWRCALQKFWTHQEVRPSNRRMNLALKKSVIKSHVPCPVPLVPHWLKPMARAVLEHTYTICTLHLLFRACQQPADNGTEQGSPDGACGYASTAATFSRRKSDNPLQCQPN